MNYYEKMLKNVKNLMKQSPEEALKVIKEELNAPYVPSDVLKELKILESKIDIDDSCDFNMSIDQIKDYFKQDESKQCIAAEELSKLNLRDYEDIISDFLLSKGSLRAKVIIMLALKKQESSREFSLLKENKIYPFVPKNIELPEESEFYKRCLKLLNDHYMKSPDKLNLSYELLYSDYLFHLPESRNIIESKLVVDKIIEYIEKSFK